MKTFALSFHADWRCARSGACCTSGWSIPVEPRVQATVEHALRQGHLRLPVTSEQLFIPMDSLPDGARTVLGVDAQGHCRFFEPAGKGADPASAPSANACAIQRRLGHEALPVSCRLFPRLCLIEPRGVSIALSHYCPSVARRLFDPPRPTRIVADPPSFPETGRYEGLDASLALPPLLRPDALLDWDSHYLFERHAVSLLTSGLEPHSALARLAGQAERARTWTVERGPLAAWLAAALGSVATQPGWFGAPANWLLADLEAALDHHQEQPVLTPERRERGEQFVDVGWPRLARPIGRYLAAHSFASWSAHQGRGLRTRVRQLELVLAVLRSEAVQVCADADQELDDALLLQAVRRSDLRLVHHASRERLAQRLSEVETWAAP